MRAVPEELRTPEQVMARQRWERWWAKHQEPILLERAIRRDSRLTPGETAARRAVYRYFQHKAWVAANPERWKQHKKKATAIYYGRRRNAPGHATTDQVAARWAYYGDRCWMCREPATQTDHLIPLSRGGSNWPANLRPACGPCNRRKWDSKPVGYQRYRCG